MTDNLRHWNALCRTDPAHTKGFQRAGGFKGTAIKPIWSIRQMTEHFGPCGVDWGMDKPEFTVQQANEEILVFCTVPVWYRDGAQNPPVKEEWVNPIPTVYGVGGDKVVIKGKDGLRTNDEAFKAAYTDALSNAFKQIGVGADVHMGLFDDAKYVREMREEFAEEAPREPAQRTNSAGPSQAAPPASAPQATAGAPRDRAVEQFFKRDNFEIPVAGIKWPEWREKYLKALYCCRSAGELSKLEQDNAPHVKHYMTIAKPEDIESFRVAIMETAQRLRQQLVA